ncbi:Ankyrin-3 [Araneus ventricosus]|uniref:Ankyrin-3 n=1 Tax=Araneus ventricosus TaxID=182803 RepID=A0A4Y2EMK7_ARAVE|nr:Ankyrin-3 [Araneus ventricosus]
MNLSQLLDEISKAKSDGCLKTYQHTDAIGQFNLVNLASKNKAFKALEYVFSEESQTLYKLSVNLTGVSENELLSATDDFGHNAFYYAMRSNMTVLLNILIDKWRNQDSAEELDDLLSRSYKELKLRNASLTREMQLFVQSKILDLRFFHASADGNAGTGNSWEEIKKRIELVVRYAQSIKNDYWDRDPDEKFIFIAECIAKSIHILKSLLKSTYDRLPWEEIEFCLTTFIICCKNSSQPNLVYNCVLNKKRLLMHLLNFSDVLDAEYFTFENNNVIELAKYVNLPRDTVTDKITRNNSEFRELYDDYEIVRDFCSLEVIKSYADLIEPSDAAEKRRHLLVSRVLQVMGEHLKNTLDSPRLSTKSASALFSNMTLNTKEIITELRDSLSHEETLFIRSEIEKNYYLSKNIERDISKIRAMIPDMLYTIKIASVKCLMKKVKLCESTEDIRRCYGPYRRSLHLHSKEIQNTNLMKGEYERLGELLFCLDKKMNAKTILEKALFGKIRYLIQKEKKKFENLKHAFRYNAKAVSSLSIYVFSENSSLHLIRRMADFFEDLPSEAPSENIEQIVNLIDELLKIITSGKVSSKNKEVNDIIWKIVAFLKFEMGFVKRIEEFKDILCQNSNRKRRNRKLSHNVSENLLTSKLSQLKETLNDFGLKHATSSVDFLSFESNMELRAITEMLVLDILCILESSCSRNPFFLDSDLPLLSGKNLRNHLAHGNALIDVCLEGSSAQLFVYAKKILTTIFPKNNKKIDRVIKCDCNKLESSIDCDLRIISNQQKLFSELGEGNMTNVLEYLNEGADVEGRDCNFSNCLHFAGKSPDIATIEWILKQGFDINSKDRSGQTVLHIAAKFNRIGVIRYLVDRKQMSLDVSDVNGKTPLHVAIENQSNDVVEYISKFSTQTTRKDEYGLTPLHTAIFRQNIDAATILLQKETNVDENTSHGNFTTFHLATMSKNLALVELLMEKKASVYSKSDFGDTPLHTATYTGHLEIVKALVINGADVNAKNEAGTTPLLNAAGFGSLEIVDFLLQHGADINVSDCGQITPLIKAILYEHAPVTKFLLERGAFVNSNEILGFTPLHFAALKGDYEIVELLLNHKAIIDCRNNKKETPLHLSAVGGHKEIVKLLLKEGAEINAIETTKSTPLHAAAAAGHINIVDLLIAEGADIEFKNKTGSTALLLAALHAHTGIVQSLLKKGADIRASNANKVTPLSLLICRGLSDLLTPEGRDVNSSDANGFSLLHQAASAGVQTLVEYCIEKSCDINARSNSGLTALHLAAQGNHHKIVSFLLNNHAELDGKDVDGYTPLFFAIGSNCTEAVEALVSHEIQNFKSMIDDEIKALRVSVGLGYYKIVDILLQNHKFKISNELKRDLLNTAVCIDHKHVVATLLERGFEIDGDAKPLHVAVRRKNYDMVYFLLTKGANPNILDKDKCTPLHTATVLGDAEMVEILLSEKADIRVESKFISSATEFAVLINQSDIIKILLQMKVIDADARGKNGYTLLHTSAMFGSLDVTRYLVAGGANVNAKDGRQRKPVHIAAERGFKDMVEFYLNCKDLADERAVLLLIAVSNGKADVCELIIERNVDVNACHTDDETSINLALEKGHKEVLSVLLNYGAYYNANSSTLLKLNKDNDAGSLLRKVKNLFTAVQNNMASEVETLLKEESNSKYCLANARCVEKETVLHHACSKGYEEIVDILLKYKTNPNTRTKTGETPLHSAVKFTHLSIVKALLSNGAIYNAVSQGGNTPLDYATDQDICDFLLFLNSIFKKVEESDFSVLEHLTGKDEFTMRAVIRAKNQDGKTLMEVAYIFGFSKIYELQALFENDLVHEFKSADKFFHEKRYDEAFLAFETILRKKVAIFGANSHPVLDVKVYLAIISQMRGDLDKALRLFREVHDSRKNSLSEDHQRTLIDEGSIADVLSEQGKTPEALRIFEAVSAKLKEKLDPCDLKVLNYELRISSALFKMNKFDEVLKINNEVEQKYAQKREERYRILLTDFQYSTAVILCRRGKHSEALRLFEEIHETRTTILTPRHSKTLRALWGVAEGLYQLKRYDESLEVSRKVLDIRKSHLPEDHIDILESEYFVGKVLYNQGMWISALKILLCLEPKIVVVAPDSDLMKANKDILEAIKCELSLYGYHFIFDRIRSKIREAKGNREK